LEDKTKIYYEDGWRLLQTTTIVGMRLDQITKDVAEMLKFSAPSSKANCALRTLRRMLHKAEKLKVICQAPKLKLKKEHGRSLRLDKEMARNCWRAQSPVMGGNALQLFRDIVILMRDTG
jgi:hypothetical protein